jgi:hypothetical protein
VWPRPSTRFSYFFISRPRTTVSGLLRRRLQQIDLDLTKARAMRHDLATVLGTGGRYMLDRLIEVRQLDRRWLRRLLTEVEAGKVRDLKPEALKWLAAQAVDAKRRS